MAQHRISVSGLVQAPAARVYDIIADYQNSHGHILPKPYFVSLTVERGGVGAGTVVSFQMRLMGRVQMFHATISEPEPGRRLVETTDTGAITTFLIEPHGNQQQTHITISTDTRVPDGLVGAVQGWLTTRLLRPIYVKELEQLAMYAAKSSERP